MASSFRITKKDVSVGLWIALWLATAIHAGLTVWAMLYTAQVPPESQVPPHWVDLFGKGPSPQSYWFYMVVLGVNIVWESWFKSRKTYDPSTYPFPDIYYSHIAMGLWAILWGFAHLGQSQGAFSVPDTLNRTFGYCCLFLFLQYVMIEAWGHPEKYEDNPKPAETEVPQPDAEVTSPQPSPSAPQQEPVQAEAAPAEAASRGPALAVEAPLKSVSVKAQKAVVPSANEMGERLLDYVRQNGQAKTGRLVGVLGSPRRTVVRNLNKLLAEGWLIREGNGPGAVYRINVNPREGKLN